MEDKEYYYVSEYQTYDEYKSFKAEQYKVKENALEKLEDSFSVDEDSASKEFQRENLKQDEDNLEKKVEVDRKDSINEEIKKIDKIQSTIAQTSATVTTSAASIAGGVAATAAAAAIVVVTSATIMSKAPKVNLMNFEVGVDYVSYEMELEDIDENLDYKLVVSNPYQTFEYEIEFDSLYRKDIIGGLKPNLQYDFKVVANDKTLGETVYFTKSFYTLKGSNPEVKANYDFVSRFDTLSYDFQYDFYISDYYNNGSDYKVSFFNNDELIFEDDSLNEENHFIGEINRLKEGNLKYVVSAIVYDELVDLATETISVVYPSDIFGEGDDPEKEEIIPEISDVLFENSSFSYHISAKHNLLELDGISPIIVFSQYSSEGEIIDVVEEEVTLFEDNIIYGNSIFKDTSFISYIIKCEYDGKEAELYKQDKIAIDTDDSSEYSFKLDENEISYEFSRDFETIRISIPIEYHSGYEAQYAGIITIYTPEGEVIGEYNSDRDTSTVFIISNVCDEVIIKAGIKKYYQEDEVEKILFEKTITLDPNSHIEAYIEASNDGKDILVSGTYPTSEELELTIAFNFYDRYNEFISSVNKTLIVDENGEYENSYMSIIGDEADYYDASIIVGGVSKYKTEHIPINKAPLVELMTNIEYKNLAVPRLPIYLFKYNDDTTIKEVEVSMYDQYGYLIYSKDAYEDRQTGNYIFEIEQDINDFESVDISVRVTYLNRPDDLQELYIESDRFNLVIDQRKPTLDDTRIELVDNNPTLKFTFNNEYGYEEFIKGSIVLLTSDEEIIKAIPINLDDQNDAKINLGLECSNFETFTYKIILEYKGKYGGHTQIITNIDTYTNSYVIEPKVFINESEYLINYDGYIPNNSNVYVSIDGNELMVPSTGLSGVFDNYAGTISYYYKIDNDRYLEESLSYDCDLNVDELNYRISCTNPGDSFVTYNQDETYNVTLFTSFMNLTPGEDIYYKVVGTFGDDKVDSTFTSESATIRNIPILDNLYFEYYVYVYRDGINYQLLHEIPSGGVESVNNFSNNYYVSYNENLGTVDVYFINIEFESLDIDVDGTKYTINWKEDSEYYDSENMKFSIIPPNQSGVMIVSGKASKYYNCKEGYQIPLEEEKYIEFTMEIEYGG